MKMYYNHVRMYKLTYSEIPTFLKSVLHLKKPSYFRDLTELYKNKVYLSANDFHKRFRVFFIVCESVFSNENIGVRMFPLLDVVYSDVSILSAQLDVHILESK